MLSAAAGPVVPALPAVPPLSDVTAATESATGAAVVATLWLIDQLSRVVAFRLVDGREVVAKARPSERRLAACALAQAAAADAGLPCPRPIGAVEVGGWTVGVEEHRPGGRTRTVAELGVQPFVDLALTLDDAVGALVQAGMGGARAQPVPPPWGDPSHPGHDVWPVRDPRLPDLRHDTTVDWVRDAAERVRRRLRGVDAPLRVGHLDFETHNMRWRDVVPGGAVRDRLVSLDDWDSLGALPEPVLVGQAAGTFTATRERFTDPTVARSQEYLDRWLATSGRAWGREEVEVAWAAGLWTKLFNVQDRIVHHDAEGVLAHARPDVEERLRLAGA